MEVEESTLEKKRQGESLIHNIPPKRVSVYYESYCFIQKIWPLVSFT